MVDSKKRKKQQDLKDALFEDLDSLTSETDQELDQQVGGFSLSSDGVSIRPINTPITRIGGGSGIAPEVPPEQLSNVGFELHNFDQQIAGQDAPDVGTNVQVSEMVDQFQPAWNHGLTLNGPLIKGMGYTKEVSETQTGVGANSDTSVQQAYQDEIGGSTDMGMIGNLINDVANKGLKIQNELQSDQSNSALQAKLHTDQEIVNASMFGYQEALNNITESIGTETVSTYSKGVSGSEQISDRNTTAYNNAVEVVGGTWENDTIQNLETEGVSAGQAQADFMHAFEKMGTLTKPGSQGQAENAMIAEEKATPEAAYTQPETAQQAFTDAQNTVIMHEASKAMNEGNAAGGEIGGSSAAGLDYEFAAELYNLVDDTAAEKQATADEERNII